MSSPDCYDFVCISGSQEGNNATRQMRGELASPPLLRIPNKHRKCTQPEQRLGLQCKVPQTLYFTRLTRSRACSEFVTTSAH